MRVGDVEGLNTLYNKDGVPLILKNERIICEVGAKIGELYFKKGGLKFLGGKGRYTFTNIRLIFIMNLHSLKQVRRTLGTGEMGPHCSFPYFMERTKKASKIVGAKEFVELPYKEITKLKIGLLGTLVEGYDNKRKYHVIMPRPVGKMFKKLLKECGIYV